MIIIGLTGSIGMGKSTAAAMMQTMGIPVHDADAAVHDLLSQPGEALNAVAAAFPYFEYPQMYGRKDKSGIRKLDRKKLGEIVFKDDEKREALENILHPFVRREQDGFIRKNKGLGMNMIAFDIPLLFETGADARVDVTINVSANFSVQRARVLERPGMNEEKFEAILKRQMPDGEKCARADYVLHSGLGRAQMMKELKFIVAQIKGKEFGEIHG